MNTLRSRVIRRAHANPELRPHLLPLLTETAGVSWVERQAPSKAVRCTVSPTTTYYERHDCDDPPKEEDPYQGAR